VETEKQNERKGLEKNGMQEQESKKQKMGEMKNQTRSSQEE